VIFVPISILDRIRVNTGIRAQVKVKRDTGIILIALYWPRNPTPLRNPLKNPCPNPETSLLLEATRKEIVVGGQLQATKWKIKI
jgi:hypothetical protein